MLKKQMKLHRAARHDYAVVVSFPTELWPGKAASAAIASLRRYDESIGYAPHSKIKYDGSDSSAPGVWSLRPISFSFRKILREALSEDILDGHFLALEAECLRLRKWVQEKLDVQPPPRGQWLLTYEEAKGLHAKQQAALGLCREHELLREWIRDVQGVIPPTWRGTNAHLTMMGWKTA
jgi:hypothetical protein